VDHPAVTAIAARAAGTTLATIASVTSVTGLDIVGAGREPVKGAFPILSVTASTAIAAAASYAAIASGLAGRVKVKRSGADQVFYLDLERLRVLASMALRSRSALPPVPAHAPVMTASAVDTAIASRATGAERTSGFLAHAKTADGDPAPHLDDIGPDHQPTTVEDIIAVVFFVEKHDLIGTRHDGNGVAPLPKGLRSVDGPGEGVPRRKHSQQHA
jgi:hypothetical protein